MLLHHVTRREQQGLSQLLMVLYWYIASLRCTVRSSSLRLY